MFDYVSKIAGALMTIISLFRISNETALGDFFRFLGLGSLMDFIFSTYEVLMSILLVLVISRWVRDWRFLLGAFLFFLAFFFLLL
jgi:hypothetical protein